MLTDMYNRNSYDEWVKENVQMPGTLIITFDLNNLKYCNDTLGHAIGDDYIKNAAGIIAEIFGNFGNCYRIGGDEFCVVIPKQNKIDPEDKLTQLEQEQKSTTPDWNILICRLHMDMRNMMHRQIWISKIPDPVQMKKCMK